MTVRWIFSGIHDRAGVILWVALVLLITFSIPAKAQSSGTVKVMVAGVEGLINLASAWLEADPLTDPRAIPARAQDSSWTGEQVRKFVRIYFPRTYEEMIQFGYIMLNSIEVWVFTDRQLKMMHDSICEDGLGGMQERSVMSMHSYISIPWAESILSDAFPNDADAVVSIDYTLHQHPMRVVINTNENVPPVFKPYKYLAGVEYSFGGAYGTNLAIPKPGAVVTSYSVGPYAYGYAGALADPGFKSPGWIPHTMYWRYGNGTTWTHQDLIGMYWNTQYNPYAPDMILAEIIFSTGRDLPDDVVLVHRLRSKFSDYASSRGYVTALMDFIDRFGANVAPIAGRLAEIGRGVGEARQLYLDQQYAESSVSMDIVAREFDDLREMALRLKDRALLWIYLVEWSVVSGVSLLTGLATWSLMVRRRLYRDVSATRLTSSRPFR